MSVSFRVSFVVIHIFSLYALHTVQCLLERWLTYCLRFWYCIVLFPCPYLSPSHYIFLPQSLSLSFRLVGRRSIWFSNVRALLLLWTLYRHRADTWPRRKLSNIQIINSILRLMIVMRRSDGDCMTDKHYQPDTYNGTQPKTLNIIFQQNISYPLEGQNYKINETANICIIFNFHYMLE